MPGNRLPLCPNCGGPLNRVQQGRVHKNLWNLAYCEEDDVLYDVDMIGFKGK